MTKAKPFLAPALALALGGLGCSSTPAAPFNQMPGSPVTVLRLQNYEPPATAAATPANPMGGLPLPPEITQWLGGGASGLPVQSFCLPGLPIPIPGCPPAGGAATPAPAANAPKFQGFRILSTAQIQDEDTKKELAKLLGKDKNFDTSGSACMYPEYGIGFGNPPNEMLISMSCHNVEARTFAWPHPNRSLKADTQSKLAEIFKKLPLYLGGQAAGARAGLGSGGARW